MQILKYHELTKISAALGTCAQADTAASVAVTNFGINLGFGSPVGSLTSGITAGAAIVNAIEACVPATGTSLSFSHANSISNTNGTAGNAGTVGTPAGCTPGNNPSAVTCGAGTPTPQTPGYDSNKAVDISTVTTPSDAPPASIAESSGGEGGSGCVICTQLTRTGNMEISTWSAAQRYGNERFSEQVMRGYHTWGAPYVKLMRKSPLFAKLAKRPVNWFAEDLAYRMGVRAKPNYLGWALRELAFRPACWSIGVFVKARDFTHLWAAPALRA